MKNILHFKVGDVALRKNIVRMLEQVISHNGWTQKQAALIIGLSQPKLSALLSGDYVGVSELKLLNCLLHAGSDVKIEISSPSNPTKTFQLVAS